MTGTAIERYKALDRAFVERAGRGMKLYAQFSALASLSTDTDAALQAERAFAIRDQLNEGLGAWRSPAKSMRLVFAAALAASGRTSEHFFAARAALAERRKARGGRHRAATRGPRSLPGCRRNCRPDGLVRRKRPVPEPRRPRHA